MSHSRRVFRSSVLLSATALVVACGGGGGGDSGISASTPVAVTSANATEVAGTSINASDGLTGNTEGVLGIVPAAVGATRSAHVNMIETLLEQIKLAPQRDTSAVSPAAVQTQSQNCDTGTLSVSFNDADNNLSLSTGDSVSLSASQCAFAGVTLNGSISMSNVVVTGDEFTPPYLLQFSLQTSGFSVSAGAETVAMSGGGTIAESSSDAVSYTSTFSGNGISITAVGENLTLTDYAITETENRATGAYSYAINATISSSGLGGSVRVTTDVALAGVDPSDPDSGQLTCVGRNNTSVTLTVIDSMTVQLAVDQDGDAIVDNTYMVSWNTL